jgi:membrane protein implicated in regulation of membrane protease activity
MFFIWGAYNSDKQRGVVGDKCPNCGRLTVLRITQHYRTQHVYFIPLGSGALTATVRTCGNCGAATTCSMSAYPRLLPEKETSSWPIDEIVRQSNPRLAEAMAFRAQLEQDVLDADRRSFGRLDPRVKLAFAKIAELDCSEPQVIELQTRLAQWEQLDQEPRAWLLRRIDELLDRVDRRRSADLFVRLIAQRFRPEMDGFLKFATFVAVFAVGITVTIVTVRDLNLGLAVGLVMALVAAIASAMFVHRQLQRWAHKRFFRKVLLREAGDRNVAVDDVMATMDQVNVLDESTDAQIRGMAQAAPLLAEVLAERSDLVSLTA